MDFPSSYLCTSDALLHSPQHTGAVFYTNRKQIVAICTFDPHSTLNHWPACNSSHADTIRRSPGRPLNNGHRNKADDQQQNPLVAKWYCHYWGCRGPKCPSISRRSVEPASSSEQIVEHSKRRSSHWAKPLPSRERKRRGIGIRGEPKAYWVPG